MSKNIKGITIVIDSDTKGLDKALSDVNKSSRDIQKELREVDKLLKFNPKNTELIAQKQKLLGEQVSTTKDKLDKLKEAEKQVQEQFERGEISEEQYRAFQREIVETESKLKHYEGQLKAVSDTKKSFGDRMDEVSKKLKSAGDKMTSTGKTLSKNLTAPVVAGGTALMGLAKKSADAMDRVDKLSQKIGMSTKSFQEWDYITSQNGMNVEQLQMGFKTLVNQVDGVTKGNQKSTETFKALGVSIEDSSGKVKSQEQIFEESIIALQGMEEGVEKAKIANDLFGRSGAELAPLINGAAGSVEELKERAHELGLVLDDDAVQAGADFTDAMDDIKRSVGAAFTKIGVDFMPILTDKLAPAITEKVVPAIGRMVEKEQDGIKWYQELSPPMQKAIKIIAGIVVGIGPFLVIAGKMIAIVGTITKVVGVVGGAIAGLTAPIAIAIGAIAAVIAIGVLLWKNWDTVKEKATQLWTSIKGKFNQIKEAITGPINTAKDVVGSAIEKIKGFFDFKWSLPKIKMPHFSVSWSKAGFWGSVGDFLGLPGKPKIGVKWYADGGIFTRPTVLPTMAGLQGFAEPRTGGEVVMPLNKLPGLLGLDKPTTIVQNYNFTESESSPWEIARQNKRATKQLLREVRV